MYVVAEVCSPLDDEAGRLVQKLLRAERIVRFLAAKEGKAGNVRDCVLGYIFMGPHMDATAGAKLFEALRLYQKRLPCLWELQGEPCRLLGCQVVTEPQAITLHQLEASLQRIKASVQRIEEAGRKRDQRDLERDQRERERDEREQRDREQRERVRDEREQRDREQRERSHCALA